MSENLFVVKPKLTVLEARPEWVIRAVARISRDTRDPKEIWDDTRNHPEKAEKPVGDMIEWGHFPAIEPASVIVAFDSISRYFSLSLFDLLRLVSGVQLSYRYVPFETIEGKFTVPIGLTCSEKDYRNMITAQYERYRELFTQLANYLDQHSDVPQGKGRKMKIERLAAEVARAGVSLTQTTKMTLEIASRQVLRARDWLKSLDFPSEAKIIGNALDNLVLEHWPTIGKKTAGLDFSPESGRSTEAINRFIDQFPFSPTLDLPGWGEQDISVELQGVQGFGFAGIEQGLLATMLTIYKGWSFKDANQFLIDVDRSRWLELFKCAFAGLTTEGTAPQFLEAITFNLRLGMPHYLYHQWVRHRHLYRQLMRPAGSFHLNPDLGYFVPPLIKAAGSHTASLYRQMINQAYELWDNSPENDLLLPNATMVEVIMNISLWELVFVGFQRLNSAAQEDTRRVAAKIKEAVRAVFPWIDHIMIGLSDFEGSTLEKWMENKP